MNVFNTGLNVSIYTEYTRVCKDSLVDEHLFNVFRSIPAYTYMLEHKDYFSYGALFLKK